MKYLKTYKIFENIIEDEISVSLRDMIQMLEDDGFITHVTRRYEREAGYFYTCVEIHKLREIFYWKDIKDVVESVDSYMNGSLNQMPKYNFSLKYKSISRGLPLKVISDDLKMDEAVLTFIKYD